MTLKSGFERDEMRKIKAEPECVELRRLLRTRADSQPLHQYVEIAAHLP